MEQITNNENGDMVFNPLMLKILYEKSLKQIAELQDKLSHCNMEIANLKKKHQKEYPNALSMATLLRRNRASQ